MSKELATEKTEKVLPIIVDLIELSSNPDTDYYKRVEEVINSLEYKEDNLTRIMVLIYLATRPRYLEEDVKDTWFEIYENFTYDPMTIEEMIDSILDYEPGILNRYLFEGINLLFDKNELEEKYTVLKEVTYE